MSSHRASVSAQSPQFVPTRDRTNSVSANSVKFSHTRSTSVSSIPDQDILPPPSLSSTFKERNESSDSLSSLIQNNHEMNIDSHQRGSIDQPRSPTMFFQNANTSSSTLLPLTRTISFNSVQGSGFVTPTLQSSSDMGPISSNVQESGMQNVGGKARRLSRLFSSSKSKSHSGNNSRSNEMLSNQYAHLSPNTHRGSFSSVTSNSPKNNANITNFNNTTNTSTTTSSTSKPNILQRQISLSRSIKDKRNIKRPAELSIQTSNLTTTSSGPRSSISLYDSEVASSMPTLSEALGSSVATATTSPQVGGSVSSISVSKPLKGHHSHHNHHHHHLHLNHHNILRSRNKDTPLSSSSSNSKLISTTGKTMYSFSTTGGGGLSTSDFQKTFQQLGSLNFKDLDLYGDKSMMAIECFSFLSSLVLPIFTGQHLQVPIEDANRLVLLFLYLKIQEYSQVSTPTKIQVMHNARSGGISVFEDIRLLFNRGLKNFHELYLLEHKNLSAESKVVKAWTLFKQKISYNIEGIFLPLQLELEGRGILIKNENYNHVWHELTMEKDLANLYVKRLLLMSFRDEVVIPIYENDEEANWIVHTEERSDHTEGATIRTTDNDNDEDDEEQEKKRIVLQCLEKLKTVQSRDSSQNLIERLLEDLYEYDGFNFI